MSASQSTAAATSYGSSTAGVDSSAKADVSSSSSSPAPAAASASPAPPTSSSSSSASSNATSKPRATSAAAANTKRTGGSKVMKSSNNTGALDDKEILELLNQKIDNIETTATAAAAATTPPPPPPPKPQHADEKDESTTAEQEQVRIRHKEILQSLPTFPSVEDRLAHLMQLISTEFERRLVCERQLAYYRSYSQRISKQRDRLESLCKELQRRNKLITEEISKVSIDQQKQHTELKEKFETSLEDIQLQLKKHSEERDVQLHENLKLRDKITQLLKYETVREEHFLHQLRTKELEIKLVNARLQQQAEYAAQEAKKSKYAKDRIDNLLSSESTLRHQLTSYAEKFEQVQTTLSKSNELFATFKSEMDKMAGSMKKLEKEKLTLAKKNQDSQLTIIQMFEQRTADKQAIDKAKRQNDKLKQLCTALQTQLKSNKDLASNNNNHHPMVAAAVNGTSVDDVIDDDDEDVSTKSLSPTRSTASVKEEAEQKLAEHAAVDRKS